MMSHRRLAIAAGIVIAIVFGGFLISAPRAREARETTTINTKDEATTTAPVSVKDVYKKGVHTLSGTVTAPDACASVSASAVFASGNQAIALNISMPPPTGVCLTIPTDIPFRAVVTAPEDTPIAVFVNGVNATTSSP